MPKIKDLGINTIPMTVASPQIGADGSLEDHGLQYFAAGEQTACSEATCGRQREPRDDRGGGGGGSDYTSACGDTSCKPEDTSACGDTSCKPPSPGKPHKGHKDASAFHPAAIAQLRQQLESHIGM